ncbi:MAG TPA: hypothetical protein VFZ98_05105, partial [Vicinamibacterales bacterium]
LDQIAEIHEQIAKGEVYRGYRSLPIAASGAIGIAAAWVQPAETAHDPIAFAIYWICVAVTAMLVGSSEILYNYIVHETASGRRHTRRVVGQFLPSVLAGGAIALCFCWLDPALVALLPGLWAICFGLGAFASRPYLPRASGWVALFYYAAGFVLLLLTRGGAGPLNGWWIGATFGTGQLMAALVLWWNLERS